MDERDLAGMMVRIGLARGIDADRLVEQLAATPLPGFLDARAFRASLVDTIEEQWRAELDSRVRRLRDQLDAPATEGGKSGLAATYLPPPPTSTVTQIDLADATAVDVPAPTHEAGFDVPRDATQIWDARRG